MSVLYILLFKEEPASRYWGVPELNSCPLHFCSPPDRPNPAGDPAPHTPAAPFLPARDRWCRPPAAAGSDTAWCSPARSAVAKLPASRDARADVLRLRERSSLRSASNKGWPTIVVA